jgi:hypothetical protein
MRRASSSETPPQERRFPDRRSNEPARHASDDPKTSGGRLEVGQQVAGHVSSRTTGLYDRRGDDVSLDEVERTLRVSNESGAEAPSVVFRGGKFRAEADRRGRARRRSARALERGGRLCTGR